MSNTKKVLVTGGGGFLGRAIVERLIKEGQSVRSLARGEYPELEKIGVEAIRGDIRDITTVKNAMDGCDIVYHVAAKPGIWGHYNEYYGINVLGTKNVIQGCRSKSIEKLIYTSSPSVVFHGMDMNGVNESVPYAHKFHAHYPKTKAMAEKLVIEAGREDLLTISLRPHLIWGPRDNHLVPRIIARAKKLRKIGKGQNKIDSIYIDNAVEAHLLAEKALLKHPEISGNVYFISNDEPIVIWDLINGILKAAGKNIVKRSVPQWAARWAGIYFESIYKIFFFPGEPRMTRFLAGELATSHWFDISAVKRDLGYQPKVSIAEGLERLEKWLKEEGK